MVQNGDGETRRVASRHIVEDEEEGDEYVGKEAFVTQAYKEQQAEMRKAEEEERQREGMLRYRTLSEPSPIFP